MLKIFKLKDGNWQLDCRSRKLNVIRKIYLGNVKRLNFKTKREAEEKRDELENIKEKFGNMRLESVSTLFDDRLLTVSMDLKEYGKTLFDAGVFYLEYLKSKQNSDNGKLIKDLLPLFIEDRIKFGGLSNDTIQNIKYSNILLNESFGDKNINQISQLDMKSFITNLNVSESSKKTYLGRFHSFFNWCIKNKHSIFNPCSDFNIKVVSKKPEIYKLNEVIKIIDLVNINYNQMLPYFLIGFFAGCRPDECKHLTWDSILQTNHIVIKIGKKNKVRTIPMENNLITWLNTWKTNNPGLPLIQPSLTNKLLSINKLLRENNIKTISDGLRHCFASYWLAKNKDYTKLEYLMANNRNIQHDHYLCGVTENEAESYWNILPTI